MLIDRVGSYDWPRVSPDGRRFVVGHVELGEAELWVYDIESGRKYPLPAPGSNGEEYTIAYGPHHKRQHLVDHDWSCTCKAYQYGSGYCKHIEAVVAGDKRCGWNAELEPSAEPARDDGGNPICPDCGAPVAARQVAG